MKEYKQIFFDLDGTLWDIHTNTHIALNEIFFEIFPGCEEKIFKKFYIHYRKWNDRLWAAYRKNKISKENLRTERFSKSLAKAQLPNDINTVEHIASSFLNKCPSLPNLMPGAKELLNHCSGKYRLHIITNGFKEVQEIKMRSSGIFEYFEQFFYSEDLGVKKPHPLIFNHALDKCQCNKDEGIMIGDDWSADILGARNIEMDQVFYNPSKRRDRRHNYKPTYVISNLLELKEIL